MLIKQNTQFNHLFLDVFLIKINLIKKIKVKSTVFVTLKVRERVLQIVNVFFSWVFSKKQGFFNKKQVISQYRDFTLMFRANNFVNFFYLLLIKDFLPKNKLQDPIKVVSKVFYKNKESFILNDSLFFNFLINFFSGGPITLEDSLFKYSYLYYNINNYNKEKLDALIYSFFNKN